MNGAEYIAIPPVAFIIFFTIGSLIYFSGARLAAKGKKSGGKKTQYACGEDVPAQRVQPDYSAFFPFALFFSIIHVTALIMATLPSGNIALIGILYLAGVAISLFTLMSR
jgi:NADH:ubiquinone oxidoreductase subunit 3 (subunit A)